jgi:muramoyltetrapeptide carboxypeptidase
MAWDEPYFGLDAADRLRQALMEPQPVTLYQDRADITARVVVDGTATGILMGGNLNLIGRAIG